MPIDFSQFDFPLIVLYATIILLWIVIQPLWSLIECVLSNRLSRNSKLAWGVCILLFSFPASFCYGVFGTQSTLLRLFTLLSVFIVGVGFALLMLLRTR